MLLEEIIEEANKIRGYFLNDQMRVLYPIVNSLKERSIIVEIGTFYGKSAKFFSLCNPCTEIYTIDIGGMEGCQGVDPRVLEVGNVRVIEGSSEEQSEIWEKPIDFLFIDGSHKYVDVIKDLEIWTPYVFRDGGWLVCHDYNFDEVFIAVNEWKTKQENWVFKEEARMFIARKGGEQNE